MKFTENLLKMYAAPLSETENEKCLRAIKEIRDALKGLGYHTDRDEIVPLEKDTYSYSVTLRRYYSNEEIQIFIQGSYANNTCVRGESDVDIAVIRRDIYESAWGAQFNPYTPCFMHNAEAREFKNDVERVLDDYFGKVFVHRKNKSLLIDGNTYRKQADTVPAFGMHHYYASDRRNYIDFNEGITIYADDGQIINNFPKQHIINGRRKNSSTNYYYKKMVRIIKKMRYLMETRGYRSANNVSSFGLESLLWNLPDELFKRYTIYRYEFGEIVDYIYNNKYMLSIYKEANEIKRLCPTSSDVENYSKFIDDLRSFYEYDI